MLLSGANNERFNMFPKGIAECRFTVVETLVIVH